MHTGRQEILCIYLPVSSKRRRILFISLLVCLIVHYHHSGFWLQFHSRKTKTVPVPVPFSKVQSHPSINPKQVIEQKCTLLVVVVFIIVDN